MARSKPRAVMLDKCNQVIGCWAARAATCLVLIGRDKALHIQTLCRELYIIVDFGSQKVVISESLQMHAEYIR